MIPELMNCQHSPSGWCLACVGELHSRWDAIKTVADAAADTPNEEAMTLVAEAAWQSIQEGNSE